MAALSWRRPSELVVSWRFCRDYASYSYSTRTTVAVLISIQSCIGYHHHFRISSGLQCIRNAFLPYISSAVAAALAPIVKAQAKILRPAILCFDLSVIHYRRSGPARGFQGAQHVWREQQLLQGFVECPSSATWVGC